MLYNTHLRIVRDAWTFLKVYMDDSSRMPAPVPKPYTDSLASIYQRKGAAWQTHNPSELCDPSEIRLRKTDYPTRERNEWEWHERIPWGDEYWGKDP